MEKIPNQICQCPLCSASAAYELHDEIFKELACPNPNCRTIIFDVNLESIIETNKVYILKKLANIKKSKVFIFINEKNEIQFQGISDNTQDFFMALKLIR